MTQRTEVDKRIELLNAYLTTPHGDFDLIAKVHANTLEADPRFYMSLVPWSLDKTSVRDHKDVGVLTLTTAPKEIAPEAYLQLRDVGLALLRDMNWRQLARMVKWLKDNGRNVPNSMKTEIRRKLRDLESDHANFDRVGIIHRSSLTYLYSTLRIAPSEHADRCLFAGRDGKTYPAGSTFEVVQTIAHSDDPYEKARLVVEYGIPFLTATSLLGTDPISMIALVDAMSPAQLMNNLARIKKTGMLENQEVKDLVNAKIRRGKKDKRVQGTKIKHVRDKVEDKEVLAALEDVRDEQIASYNISRSTALILDVSASMEGSIEFAQEAGAMIGLALGDIPFEVLTFNTATTQVHVNDPDRGESWRSALALTRAGGGTAIGSPVQWLMRHNIWLEQLVFITDQDERHAPTLYGQLQAYNEQVTGLNVIVVHLEDNSRWAANANDVESACRQLGIACDRWDWNRDYTSLPNLLRLMSGGSIADTIEEILEYQLPQRLPA